MKGVERGERSERGRLGHLLVHDSLQEKNAGPAWKKIFRGSKSYEKRRQMIIESIIIVVQDYPSKLNILVCVCSRNKRLTSKRINSFSARIKADKQEQMIVRIGHPKTCPFWLFTCTWGDNYQGNPCSFLQEKKSLK